MGQEDEGGRSSAPQQQSGGGIRFAISKRKQAQVKALVDAVQDLQEENVEFVTSLDADGGSGAPKKVEKIIPKLENSWKPEKRIKNLVNGEEVKEFVSEVMEAGPMEGVQYGLSVRQPAASEEQQGRRDLDASKELKAKLDKQVLDEHLSELPEPANLAAYENMPVDSFGEALLRGMGWKEGTGFRGKPDAVPVQYISRPDRLGLGATPAAKKDDRRRKHVKPGESREKKPDLVAAVGADGKIRSVVPLDEKLVERVPKGVFGGKLMFIASGTHAGLRGTVLGDKEQEFRAGDRVPLRLQKSGETVSVRAEELVELGSLQEDRTMKKLKELQLKDAGSDASWLRNQIKVRVVSKALAGGRLYRKKGRVVDVVTPWSCDIVLDEDGSMHQGVKQSELETVVPKKGGRVVLLLGDHRGSFGKLIDRNQETERAAVQLDDTLDIVRVSMDDIAEVIGED